MSDSPTTFAALPLAAPLLAALHTLGFAVPTPIQAACIPALLAGRDLLGQSQTGSGKTFAYGLPLLQALNVPQRHLQALVLCPTRELASQVATELRKAARSLAGVRILEVCGGQPGYGQRRALDQGVHVVVGTPGRCMEMIERGAMSSEHVGMVVLDEADRMLDLGFQEQVERILGELPTPRQTAFFSATFPPSIEAMCERWQADPVRVVVAGEPLEIRHLAYSAEPEERAAILMATLSAHEPGSAIVFANFKETVRSVTRSLTEAGISAGELHGDLEQVDRDRVMARLRNGSVRVLVATDVAARGIDILGLDCVVNFQIPPRPDAYLHRTGRTGRAGKPGLAISLVSSRERERLRGIGEALGLDIPVNEPPAPRDLAPPPTAAMKTIFIGGGRKDKLRPGDILGALTGPVAAGGAGFSSDAIGRIEIHDRFTYVAVAESVADAALVALQQGRVKGRRFRVEAV